MPKKFPLSKILGEILPGQQITNLDDAGFVRTSLLLHKDQYDLLRRLAVDCDRSMSSLVRRSLRVCLAGVAEEFERADREAGK